MKSSEVSIKTSSTPASLSFKGQVTRHTIIFRPRQKRQTLDLAFNISNYSIDRVKEVTFLGVILHEHLTWKSRIHNVVRKVSKAVGIIYKSSFCPDNSSLRILYFSLSTHTYFIA